jgi:hypothetical protein
MANRFAPSTVKTDTSKGESNTQQHTQKVTQNKTTTTADPGKTTTTTHPARTVTENTAGITSTNHSVKGDAKTQIVTEDAGFKIAFSIKINGGLNAGGSAPALP